MRKIEIQMNSAIAKSGNMSQDNTKVISNDEVSFVYLHGNIIAMIGDTWLRIFDGDYRSQTTKSRLNAILTAHGNGERIYQKSGDWFLQNSDGSVIPFMSGMRLA